MNRFFAIVGTLLALALLAATPQPSSSDADARFEALLSAIDTLAPRNQLEAAWPDARDRLMAAAAEEDRDLWTRQRAITLLGQYPEPAVRELLEQLALHPDKQVRRWGVYTLGRTFGTPGDHRLVSWIAGATADPESTVRDWAIRALRWIEYPAAADALHALAETHPLDGVRGLARLSLERRR